MYSAMSLKMQWANIYYSEFRILNAPEHLRFTPQLNLVEIDGEEWICISQRCFSKLVIFVIVSWISFARFTVPGGRLSYVIFCIVINSWPYREIGALLCIFGYLKSHDGHFRGWFESRYRSYYKLSRTSFSVI
jgi:hypothetical protein